MTTTTSQARPRSNSYDAHLGYPLKKAYRLERAASSPFSAQQKRLQTIESGIALHEAANHSPDSSNIMMDVENTSPDSHHELLQWQMASSQSSSPVIYPSNSDSHPPAPSTNLPPLHPSNTSDPPPPSPDLTTPKDIIDGKHHQTKHSYNPSSTSYYSADAGKHGFFSRTKSNGSTGSDSDDNGSLVLMYMPGEETPPAEYALPASILQIYGEEDREGVAHVVLRRGASDRSNCSSISSTGEDDSEIYSLTPDEYGEMAASVTKRVRNMTKDEIESDGKKKSQQLPPPLPGDNSPLSSPEMRILPYHERKRLNGGTDEDEAKKKMDLQVKEQQQRRKKSTTRKETKGRCISGKAERQVTSSLRKDDKESSLLLPTHIVHNGKSSNHYGAINQNGSNNISPNDDHNDHQQKPSRTGWFGNLVTIVAGKDEQITTIEEESKSYRDQAGACLEKTEQERMKLKEASKREELNQVTIPTSLDGHSRSRMSSLTNALYSIASCSDDDEDETTDGESSSHEYDEDEESGTPIAANTNPHRVWKYGDKTVTSSTARKISLRDERMQRERLIEEEYEYRLRALRHENKRLAMRFRLFVLISVAFIFAGAMAFAIVVCIKMLFG
eukprot:scaffold202_cov149-Skeletonema_marinoi.AAC.5